MRRPKTLTKTKKQPFWLKLLKIVECNGAGHQRVQRWQRKNEENDKSNDFDENYKKLLSEIARRMTGRKFCSKNDENDENNDFDKNYKKIAKCIRGSKAPTKMTEMTKTTILTKITKSPECNDMKDDRVEVVQRKWKKRRKQQFGRELQKFALLDDRIQVAQRKSLFERTWQEIVQWNDIKHERARNS